MRAWKVSFRIGFRVRSDGDRRGCASERGHKSTTLHGESGRFLSFFCADPCPCMFPAPRYWEDADAADRVPASRCRTTAARASAGRRSGSAADRSSRGRRRADRRAAHALAVHRLRRWAPASTCSPRGIRRPDRTARARPRDAVVPPRHRASGARWAARPRRDRRVPRVLPARRRPRRAARDEPIPPRGRRVALRRCGSA